jgi:antitoxin component HigA of HigAB toxin-antitoxin module
MTDEIQNYDTFARILQTAYQEAHLHSPQAIPEVIARLRGTLEAHGVKLTDDVLGALAFAIAEGRGL